MRRHAHGRRSAFTLVELLVVVGVIAVLVMIVVPAISGARALARRADCLSNLKAIANTLGMYATDNHEQLPTLWRKEQPFETYWMWTTDSGPVNLGILAKDDNPPHPKTFYCVSQERLGNPSIIWNGTDNQWDGDDVRSSYPARLIKDDQGQPMEAGTKLSWNKLKYGEDKVIYSDFLGVNGYEDSSVVQGVLEAPHGGKGYNRLFGEGSARWAPAEELTIEIDDQPKTPAQQIQLYEELDEIR